eukprot:TRINITY_DN25729_c0_g1_i1.p1 TRINITY_DN25729_c0_g1~~TRINITY_DN25729_c0_g1_i1.p1  ORF type:complete len:220 (+),score=31.48 TRINITY_DN25729_c0_g1_i1:166-825(+)
MLNGTLSYLRAQSDLVVSLEKVYLSPNGNGNSKLGNVLQIQKTLVLEYFGPDLSRDLGISHRWSEEHIDKLTRFLIRALKMLNQRGISHGAIKPSNIVRDDDFNFKLTNFDDHDLWLSDSNTNRNEHSSKSFILKGQSQITNEDLRLNDLYSSGMTLLQIALMLDTGSIKKLEEELSEGKKTELEQLMNAIPAQAPGIGVKLKEVINCLLYTSPSPRDS